MYQQIYTSELKERLQSLAQPVLLDVRQPVEHAQYSIPNSILIPLNELGSRIDEIQHLQDQEIIIYCKAGIRSALACQILAAHGFNSLFNLADGIAGW